MDGKQFSTMEKRNFGSEGPEVNMQNTYQSSSLMGPNIIDLEAQDLSSGQVKAIHGQIKRDCSLLRNRVRMLQNEMLKANKKIEETKKKTKDIRQIKKQNDERYVKKLEKDRED